MYTGYNEESHRCSECKDCIDSRCMFFDGAKIDDINDAFVCRYFVNKAATEANVGHNRVERLDD